MKANPKPQKKNMKTNWKLWTTVMIPWKIDFIFFSKFQIFFLKKEKYYVKGKLLLFDKKYLRKILNTKESRILCTVMPAAEEMLIKEEG